MKRAGKIAAVLFILTLCPGPVRSANTDLLQVSHTHARSAESLQHSGNHQRAVEEYRQALEFAQQGTDSDWQILLMAQLGGALLSAGQADEAERVLRAGLVQAQATDKAGPRASLLNNLAHLFKSRGDTDGALSGFRECQVLAKQVSRQALVARCSLGAAEVSLVVGRSVDALIEEAWQATRMLPPGRDRAWLSVRNALILKRTAENDPNNSLMLFRAARRLRAAAEVAESASDMRAASWAWGSLGELYENQQQYSEALSLTATALFLAQQASASGLRYRWEWQKGRIHASRDNFDSALDAYRRSVSTLQSVRAEFSAGNDAFAADLRKDASPLFLALVDLLLRQSDTEPDLARQQELLHEARETVELLKTTEVQDYFQDDCVAAVRARIRDLDETIVPGTAVLYPISLPDRLELLLSLQDGLRRFSVPVEHKTLTDAVHQFRRRLEKRTTRQYLRPARQLYQWLISPLEQELDRQHISTLVVVPGPALRAVPIAALHDGRDFLIRRYAVATTPSLRLTDPRPIQRQSVSLLLNGLTESVQGYPPLVHVSTELETIQKLYGGKVYRDRNYQKAVVQQELANEEYSIVHFATHGQFSGKVQDSFILTWDGRIDMDDLENYVGVSWFRKDSPVELLTLSACETAVGDDTAALGLASVAIKAGARSALASLWSINDQASSVLVSDFYEKLRDPDVSKAQALRLAQTGFLDDLRYRHPSYWAPFLLIGNWL